MGGKAGRGEERERLFPCRETVLQTVGFEHLHRGGDKNERINN